MLTEEHLRRTAGIQFLRQGAHVSERKSEVAGCLPAREKAIVSAAAFRGDFSQSLIVTTGTQHRCGGRLEDGDDGEWEMLGQQPQQTRHKTVRPELRQEWQ